MPNPAINRRVLLGPPPIVGGGLVDVVIYSQTFGSLDNTLPTGWTYPEGFGVGQWNIDNGTIGLLAASNGYAGASGKSDLEYFPQGNDTSGGGDYMQFAVDCTGYDNIRVKHGLGYFMEAIGLGTPMELKWQYSINGGGAWNDVPIVLTTPYPADNTWEYHEYSFALVSNQSILVRIVGMQDGSALADQLMGIDDTDFIGDEI